MTQNFIMRPSRSLATRISIFFITVLLLGCSAARLGYSNGETISYFWLNNYVDFDADQKTFVTKELATLFSWHRRTQLGDYVQLLTRAQKQAQSPVTEAELQGDYNEFKKRVLVMADKAIPSMATLAMSLKPYQIANIEKKFASNNDKYRKEYLRGDVEQRQRFRFKKTLKQAEYWFGSFSSEQEQQIRAASDARPLNNELVLADRMQRQAAMIAMLKKIEAEKPGREAAIAMLKDYVTATMDRHASPEHKAYFDAYNASNIKLAAFIVNHATPAQKVHFTGNLQQWINDFNKWSH
ncbi:MAG: hypothetical protein JWQ23_1095 [Herminiimonas sp.]|nr:hypothetical protein [Herminiimonas sp.]